MYASGAEERSLDVASIGELVVDFISIEQTDTLGNATTFRKHLGGSPANIAVYVSSRRVSIPSTTSGPTSSS
jgi:5-dehydro-2-deoxygluconokinase